MSTRKRLWSIIFLWLALVFAAGPASAHVLDSDLVVDRLRMGPYLLSVWTVFTVDGVVHLHVSASLTEESSQAPVIAANVRYEFEMLSGEADPVEVLADPAMPTNGFMHESSLNLPDPGRYRVTVTVEDGAGPVGDVVYYIVAYPASVWTKGYLIAMLVIGIIGSLWLLREGLTAWTRK